MKKVTLEGPVFPIVTPFVDDPWGARPIDVPALERYIDFLLEYGAKNVMVASATSRFAQLTEAEIRQINQVTAARVGKRGIAIASTGIHGTTAVHVETAQHAESVGAAILACEYPWRYQNRAALVDYFRTIVDHTHSIRLLVHVTPGRSELGGLYRYDVPALEEICALPRVIGMKEASGDPQLSREIWQALAGKTSIIVAGKGSQSYYEAFDAGVSGYFVGTGNIVPHISMDIYYLMRAGKIDKARELIDQHEIPFLNKAKQFGWHASLKAALAELDMMSLVERSPMVPVTNEQRGELVDVLKQCGWLDAPSVLYSAAG